MSASFLLALIGREGLMGMIGVDKIGEIRRAYFEQARPIKEIPAGEGTDAEPPSDGP